MEYDPPLLQHKRFFQWFKSIGVKSFDIHVREPLSEKIGYYDKNWRWITHNEDVSYFSFFIKLQKWIRYHNFYGADIFFRPHRSSINPVIFLDDVSKDNALKIARKYSSCVVETSHNNTQVWLATNASLDREARKSAQSYIRDVGYTDPGSISGDHLGRLCGVLSQKHKCWVNLLATTTNGLYTPIFPKLLSRPLGGSCVIPKGSRGSDASPSGKEFSWVLRMLRSGINHTLVTSRLLYVAISRSKRSPDSYSKRTVKKAMSFL